MNKPKTTIITVWGQNAAGEYGWGTREVIVKKEIFFAGKPAYVHRDRDGQWTVSMNGSSLTGTTFPTIAKAVERATSNVERNTRILEEALAAASAKHERSKLFGPVVVEHDDATVPNP